MQIFLPKGLMNITYCQALQGWDSFTVFLFLFQQVIIVNVRNASHDLRRTDIKQNHMKTHNCVSEEHMNNQHKACFNVALIWIHINLSQFIHKYLSARLTDRTEIGWIGFLNIVCQKSESGLFDFLSKTPNAHVCQSLSCSLALV